jgi:DNA processing protein
LITADFALEEGREVFAVPGEITSTLSAGANALLRLGATPVTAAGDVLESLGIQPPPERTSPDSPILDLLPATADELVRKTGLAVGEVIAALAELDIAGLAAEGEGIFRRLA